MLRPPHPPRPTGHRRPGYVLFAVLIVVVVLSLVAYRYADAMTLEAVAAQRNAEAAEAKAFAVSGVYYAAGMLADPTLAAPSDNAALFGGVAVGDASGARQGGRFSLVNLSDAGVAGATGEARYPLRYGASDESAKLNVNALILKDPTGQVLHDSLMKLPNMTEEVADAIVDWVDADSTTRTSGAEDDVYAALSPNPYHCKNGPLNSVEELLLVRGVTPDLLFGGDRNRNGKQDAGETADAAGGEFTRGWSEYLTCYGRELALDSTGVVKAAINGTDLVVLADQLTQAVGQELSDYMVYYRVQGTGETVGTGIDGKTKVAGTAADLRPVVQAMLDKGTATAKRNISSMLTVFGTQIPLPVPAGSPPNTPQIAVPSPLNDPAKLATLLPLLLDRTTTETGFELAPRVNVYTAPREVIAALPGLDATDADKVMAARGSVANGGDGTAAWLVVAAQLTPDKFKAVEPFVGGRTTTYRVQSVGYFGSGGPVARVEAVVDVAQAAPRIVAFRDLTDLGRGFTDDQLPR